MFFIVIPVSKKHFTRWRDGRACNNLYTPHSHLLYNDKFLPHSIFISLYNRREDNTSHPAEKYITPRIKIHHTQHKKYITPSIKIHHTQHRKYITPSIKIHHTQHIQYITPSIKIHQTKHKQYITPSIENTSHPA